MHPSPRGITSRLKREKCLKPFTKFCWAAGVPKTPSLGGRGGGPGGGQGEPRSAGLRMVDTSRAASRSLGVRGLVPGGGRLAGASTAGGRSEVTRPPRVPSVHVCLAGLTLTEDTVQAP